MKTTRELRKPANWQDFEKLCCEIWKVMWNDPYTKPYGRNGQAQKGVDIYGKDNGDREYSGVQCKRYEELTAKVIDEEIENAMNFVTPLKNLVIATTANRDAKIEAHIIKRDIENREKGLFGIKIMEWEDIVDFIDQHEPILRMYEQSLGLSTISSVKVSFSTGTDEIEIKPKFIKKIYHYPNPSPRCKVYRNQPKQDIFHPFAYDDIRVPQGELNHSFVPIDIQIKNDGLESIEPVSMIFTFPEEISIAKTNFRIIGGIPKWEDSNISVDPKSNTVSFYVNKILPSRPHKVDRFYVKPPYSLKEFDIDWDFASDKFTKKGKLKVRVNAIIEEEYISTNKDILPENIIEDAKETAY